MFEKVIPFVDHRAHINYGGLHLKSRGTKLVANNILNVPKSVRLKVMLHGCNLAFKRK